MSLTTGRTGTAATFHHSCFARHFWLQTEPVGFRQLLLCCWCHNWPLFSLGYFFTRAVFMSENFISISALCALLLGLASHDWMREEERDQSAPDNVIHSGKMQTKGKTFFEEWNSTDHILFACFYWIAPITWNILRSTNCRIITHTLASLGSMWFQLQTEINLFGKTNFDF